MILKKGLTGYTDGDLQLDRELEASVDEFKRYCYSFVQQLKGKILEWYKPTVEIAYAHAHIKINEHELYIFHHNLYDFLCINRLKLTGVG